MPLLSMQQSVLLCISTILDSGNRAPLRRALVRARAHAPACVADYTKMMELVDGAFD